jgi:hypothetical protein
VLDAVATDNLISKVEHDGTVWLTGTAEASAKITIKFLDEGNANAVASTRYVNADEYGNWYLPYSANTLPVDGTYTIRVTATDSAGLVSGDTDRTGVIVDSSVPASPVINIVATDDVIDALENSAGFNITGTGEAGATITLELSSGHTLTGGNTTTVAGDGTWSLAVGIREAGEDLRFGEELLTVYQTDAAGNTSAQAKRLIDVVTTLVASGDLSAQDLSGISKLELNGAATLPSDTARLPQAIDAKGNDITAGATVSLTALTLSNLGDLNVSNGVTLTMSASQASSFNAGGTITLTGSGIVAVTASGNLSAFDLDKVTLTLNGATTLPNATENQPDAINAAGYTVTIPASVDLTGVNLSNLGSLAVGSSGQLTILASQVTGKTVSGSGRLVMVTAMAADTDLSGVDANVTLYAYIESSRDVTANPNLTKVDGFVVVGAQTFTALASQVDGREINNPNGGATVIINELGATTNLSQIYGNAAVTAHVATSLDISANANLGPVDTYTVASGQTLTANAAQVTAKTVNGAGSISILALAADSDLTNVNPGGTVSARVSSDINVTANGNLGTIDSYSVDASRTLTATAAQMTGLTATGDGTVAVTALHATAAANLSGLTTNTVTALASLTDATVNF